MIWLAVTLGLLALLSFALSVWQVAVAMRFPLHQRITEQGFTPTVTILKPLKGCDAHTEQCLRSWLAQDYSGATQVLFGVASLNDPVCAVVKRLFAEFPGRDAQLITCPQALGANSKVSTLAQLYPQAKHELILVSDADVRVPSDFLANVVFPLRNPDVGLVNCLYRIANPTTLAMRWEAIAINADFWSQVLQARSLKPLDFALGAVMVLRSVHLEEIGGFAALVDYLADDYQLGQRISARGQRIELCPVVTECWEPPRDWPSALNHQLRWARTIRVCKPLPYFFSILSNATLWPVLWLLVFPANWVFLATSLMIFWRMLSAQILQNRLTGAAPRPFDSLLVLLKDLLGVIIWAAAFVGNEIHWRGETYRVRSGGKLVKVETS